MTYSKLSCLLLSSFILSNNCYTQEKGYKDLQLGSYLFNKKLIELYKCDQYTSDSTLFRLESKLTQFICDEPVDYIDIKMNADSSINRIDLYTKEIIVKNVEDYFDRYKGITNCIINTIGKASYYEDGNDRIDGRMIMAWTFSDNIVLALYSYSPSISEKKGV